MRARWWAVGAGVLVAGAAAVAIPTLLSNEPDSAAVTPSLTTSTSASPLSADEVAAMTVGLTSQSPQDVASVLAPEVAEPYLAGDAVALLPEGSTIELDQSGWVESGDLASVPARVTGPQPGSWLVLLERVNGQWLVYGTTES